MVKAKNRKKGQSTLEYIILVTGVIAILLIFLNPTTGVFNNRFNATLGDATGSMQNMARRLNASYPNQ